MHDIAATLAAQGIAAACPQYRLAPLHPYPAAVEDVQEFVRFARSRADEWNVTPSKVGAMGISAGGHLALMLGLTNPPAPQHWPREARSQVQAVVDICGLTDLTDPLSKHFEIAHSFLLQFMGAPPEGNDEVYKSASPLYHVSPDDPPMLIVHGEEDDVVPVAQSDALVDALRLHGVEVEYHRLPGELHGFRPETSLQILDWTLRFFKEKLA